jgi:prefoldin subunit 5
MSDKPETLKELSERVDALEAELESVQADFHHEYSELEATVEALKSELKAVYEDLSLKIRRLQK